MSPTPTDPLDLRAVQALLTLLTGISTASGYFYDVAAGAVVMNPKEKIEDLIAPDGPRPFVIIQMGANADSWRYQPADQLRVDMPVTVHWVHDAVAGSDASKAERFSRGSADVEKAICADRSLGGLVMDTRIQGRSLDDDDGRVVWVVLPIVITFYRTYGEP